jgi:hypothetical protein
MRLNVPVNPALDDQPVSLVACKQLPQLLMLALVQAATCIT